MLDDMLQKKASETGKDAKNAVEGSGATY